MTRKEYSLSAECGYRIVRRLGSGGEGTVYLVCHINTEQLRAAKVLTNIREDRRHELNMMKHLKHNSLPRVIDVLEQSGYVWLIMEYIHGERLDQLALRGISEAQIWSVARQLSQVLMYLHSRKIPVFHLDIKPSNILIRPDESLVLIDFGASIRGHPDEGLNKGYGTLGFAAPEQRKIGGIVDGRTDIYGVGAVLYYCCYGKIPKGAWEQTAQRSWVDFLINKKGRWRHQGGRMLARIIRRCLLENPDDRYEDSRQLYKAICIAQSMSHFYRNFGKTVGAALLFLTALLFLFDSFTKEEIVTAGKRGGTQTAAKMTAETTIGEGAGAETESETENSEMEKAEAEEREYYRLLEIARGTGFTQAVECYERAAGLCPADGEWYLQLMEQVTADGLFDLEEENAVKKLIYSVQENGETTALEQLKENREAYGTFAYRMGLAYWYYYEGSGGKSAAAWWFECAVASQEDSCDWLETAKVLSRIGSYYGMLGNTGADEGREEREWNYWNDLKELWYMYRTQQEDALICYETGEELLSLLIMNAYEIWQQGETREEMTRIISEIKVFLESDSMKDELNRQKKLEEQSAEAWSAIERVFQSETGGIE
ncbi:MAG: serine/threonine protein kinase [Lachnospiraceae bacterium]|nr:serine/threonine protein kinase [Lachnospiraceae bacterium]